LLRSTARCRHLALLAENRDDGGELTIALCKELWGDWIALRRVQLDGLFGFELSCHDEEVRIDREGGGGEGRERVRWHENNCRFGDTADVG
jgi:hypothetical protein